jgi:hypothetical protein
VKIVSALSPILRIHIFLKIFSSTQKIEIAFKEVPQVELIHEKKQGQNILRYCAFKCETQES